MYLNADLKSKMNAWTDTNLPDWYLGRDQNSDVAFLGIDLYNAWLNIDIFSGFFFIKVQVSCKFVIIACFCYKIEFQIIQLILLGNAKISKIKITCLFYSFVYKEIWIKVFWFFFLNIEHAGNAWIDKSTRIVCYWLHFTVLKLFIYWL